MKGNKYYRENWLLELGLIIIALRHPYILQLLVILNAHEKT